VTVDRRRPGAHRDARARARATEPTQGSRLAVEIRGLVKDYGRLRALHGIDLDVPVGQIVGFLGPNGAGKSTTIRCLLDLIRPTSGSLRVLGLDVRSAGVEVRRRLAYVPGELRLPREPTVGGFLDSVARLRGDADSHRRADLLERLDVDPTRPTRSLSSGQRRKTALVAALMTRAELLVLDEPTSGLDPLVQQVFLRLLAEARNEGRTVLLSSHVLSEVQRAADRVVVLRAGRVVSAGTVEQLRATAARRLEVEFAGAAPGAQLAAVPGLRELRTDGDRVSALLVGEVQPLLTLLARHQVRSMLLEEPDLDEAFLHLYGESA
jgi:ABC-2 type transport system ATP-binding protein